MTKIIKAENLPEGDHVHLAKGFTGEWRVVYPWKKEDGKINWFAIFFGSKGNLIMLLTIAAIVTAVYFGILELIGSYQEVVADPCGFCAAYNNKTIVFAPEVENLRLIPPPINFSF